MSPSGIFSSSGSSGVLSELSGGVGSLEDSLETGGVTSLEDSLETGGTISLEDSGEEEAGGSEEEAPAPVEEVSELG